MFVLSEVKWYPGRRGLLPFSVSLSLRSIKKRKTSGEQRTEIDLQTSYGGLIAVKHYVRILAASFPKGINSSQLQTLLGDFFNPSNQSYHQYPVGWKVTYSTLCTCAPEASEVNFSCTFIDSETQNYLAPL